MKVCGISDMHGIYEFNIEPCDVLCICGDILPLNVQMSSKKSEKWLKKDFILWCKEQPVKEILVVGGNHDFFIYRHPDKVKEIFKDTNIHYLIDECFVYEGKKFWGTPWCHMFGNWAFMPIPDYQKNRFALMNTDIDVLLTHDAPYGVSDICLQESPWNRHEHIGNPELAEAIKEKQPRYNIHGHLHSTNHNEELLGETKVYNVSLLDEKYMLSYYPLYFDI